MATDIGIIHKIDIDKEMRGAYLDYAMSVIVSRALPDVRDGLKPVHRRILYAMHSMGLRHDKPHRKSARIVGEVLGKFHPHGDAAVYDAMVRLAQDFSMRYPLVDGQGNFGSIDGDSAAAMRYTEARLAAIAETMIADLEKDTVDWGANFDDTLNEPQVMPAALPNLLLNGSSGIAVGMATNIPPHNLGEIVDALAFVIDHYHAVEDISLEHLMQFVKGPDFPTGGIVYRYRADKDGHEDVITKAYAGGRGRLIVQAKVHVEAMSRNRNRLVITELPYQTNKTRLIERIAELVRDGRVEGITDLRDESDRQGMRIAIELTRNVEPKDILETLYKYTPMQQTFGVNMLALVDGQPRLLSLKRLLLLYLEHRREIVRRRSEYDLAKARERAHILEGLLIALANLDEVIATIRRSPDTDTARSRLMRKFKLSQVQTQAILDMPLKRLSRLERDKLKEEHKQLLGQIADLEYLLAHPQKMLSVIKEELLALKEQYNDSRRTQIVDKQGLALTTGELLDDQEVLVLLTKKGLFFQQCLAGRRRGSLPRRVADAAIVMAAAPARDSVFLFTAAGQAVQQRIHQIPGEEGVHFSEITDLQPDDEVVAMLALPVPDDETHSQHSLLLVTRTGRCKRIAISELWAAAHTSPLVMNVEADDALVSAVLCDTDDDILLATRLGQSIRFSQDEVRVMGLPAGGVLGMKLSPGDQVVGADMGKADRQVLLLTTEGYGVRTPVDKYPRQKRHGSGVLAMRLTQKHGAVECFAVVDEEPEMFVIGRTGAMRVLRLGDVPAGGRGVRGRQIAGLKDADLQKLLVIVIPKVKEEDDPAPPPLPPPPLPKRPSRTSSGRSIRSKVSASPVKAPAKAAGTTKPAAKPPPAAAKAATKTPRGRKPAGGAATKPAAKPPPAATKSAAKTPRGRKPAGDAATKPAAKPPPAATKSAAKTPRGRKAAGGAATKPAAKPPPAAAKAATKTPRGRKATARKKAGTKTTRLEKTASVKKPAVSKSKTSGRSAGKTGARPAKPGSLDAIKKSVRRKRKSTK